MRIRFLGHYLYVPVIILALVESLAILYAYFVAVRIVLGAAYDGRLLYASGALVSACAFLSLVAMGLYCQRLRDRMPWIVLRVTVGLLASGFVARLLSLVLLDRWIPGPVLGGTLILSWVLLLATRVGAPYLMDEELFKRRVLVLGSGRRAARVLQLRRRADRRGFRVVGFVAMGGDQTTVPSEHVVKLPTSLLEYARANAIREIVVAMDDRRGHLPYRALLDCKIAGVGISELSNFLERETGKVFLDTVDPSWLIFGGGFKYSLLRRFFDRTFDLIVSAITLLATWPLMLLVILAIKIEDGFGAPVLYTQERVGQHGRVFSVLKFRSMRFDAEADGHASWAQLHDSRVTRVGLIIRMTRLDELPQLLNVLRGKMSFVGPRPERPTFVAHLGEEIPFYGERHSVKPGITGWAQLCYPYGASDRDALEKLQYDLFYVKNRGLMFDTMILLQTVAVILFGRGAR